MGFDRAEYGRCAKKLGNARTSLLMSNLHPSVKLTANIILEQMKGQWDFEWGWIPQNGRTGLTKWTGFSERTIKNHVNVLRTLNIFNVEAKHAEVWDIILREKYGVGLKNRDRWPKHPQNGYGINWGIRFLV
jgi:hypothetical protein